MKARAGSYDGQWPSCRRDSVFSEFKWYYESALELHRTLAALPTRYWAQEDTVKARAGATININRSADAILHSNNAIKARAESHMNINCTADASLYWGSTMKACAGATTNTHYSANAFLCSRGTMKARAGVTLNINRSAALPTRFCIQTILWKARARATMNCV
jgi:hypothetical protein